ncbi:hypothetical protein APHAL10511_002225 [Amanita phalloides]|nr:hypothetical protein APHAL10511_002225 [Amanita phalloides]
MSSTRRPRSQQDSQSLYAGDTETDNEQETPRPQRLKKRISEAYAPDNDASFTPESGRPPLRTKSVNINDDAAEKRKRRKSTKLNVIDNALPGPSSEGLMASDQDHSEAVRAGKQKQLNTVAPPQISDTPFDVMNSNFEEWMKMATDNKINAANSWSFALIDYFHDMSLLRNVDDNSINFQRASCTLDGCVKIWTSRVDSVGAETGKLLNNIATGGMNEDGDDVNFDNPEADPTQAKRKQKSHRPGATLVKDSAQLKSKKLDLEFSVDPLFKKTCADFDEGGAQGLLMNHLSLGMGNEAMRVIFDASDSIGGKADDEEDEDLIEPEDDVDLSYLRKQFLPDLSVLENKAISHSLAGFSFSKDAFSFEDTTKFLKDNSDQNAIDDDDEDDFGGGAFDAVNEDGPPPVEDFFVGVDAAADEYGGDMLGGDDNDDQNDNGSPSTEGNQAGDGRPAQFVPFDPRRLPTERDLIMAMTDADGDGGTMDYFDQNFLKNWAGPEHWKLRKVIRKPDADASTNKAAAKPRQKKEAFKIDFLTPMEDGKSLKDITKELFAPATKGISINMPGTGATSAKKGKRKAAKEKEKRDDHRLPDDMHFSSRQLVTLFLKPKFYLKMRGHNVRFNEAGDGEVDENFWAQAAADQAAGRNDGEGNDTDETNAAVPFATQFFHDDYDDGPGFDDIDDGDGMVVLDAGEQDLLAATTGQTRRVRPEFVNYAKRAKRVDVRKLKENIWKGLDIVTAPRESEDGMDVDECPPTDPSEGRAFAHVIDGLQKSYPREKMEEISTSFCFICLLHLANEEGLKLEVNNADDAEGVGRKAGDIWGLKIYRDPAATPAA